MTQLLHLDRGHQHGGQALQPVGLHALDSGPITYADDVFQDSQLKEALGQPAEVHAAIASLTHSMTHLKEGHRNLKHGSQRFRVQFRLPAASLHLQQDQFLENVASVAGGCHGDGSGKHILQVGYKVVVKVGIMHKGCNNHQGIVPALGTG